VHCVSDEIRHNAERLGMPAHKARVIRPAVDPTLFQMSPNVQYKQTQVLRLVTTGSIIWRKGMEYLIHGLALARQNGVDARLEIIGDGPERERVLYTALDLGIEDCVKVLGALPPSRVRDRLQQADVFVLSSLSEGISNAVLEAMACGLPIITTDCGGMREAVDDGVEGLVIPTRDARATADALRKLASGSTLRQTMGAAARLRIEREFTLEKHIDAWMNMLCEVHNSSRLAAS
jgi:colanic acid/amylovoran biosynthesis glycosyltransferase